MVLPQVQLNHKFFRSQIRQRDVLVIKSVSDAKTRLQLAHVLLSKMLESLAITSPKPAFVSGNTTIQRNHSQSVIVGIVIDNFKGIAR